MKNSMAGRSSSPDFPALSGRASGRRSGGDTDYVLDFGLGDTEILGDVRQRVPRHEAIDEILDPRTAVNDQRHPKRSPRIDDDIRVLVGRQANPGGPAVLAVGDALQVVAHDLSELPLPGADDRKAAQLLVVLAGGVVVEHLRAIGVQTLGRQRVIDADTGGEHLDRRPNALHRNAGTAERRQDVCLREADERHRRLPPMRRKAHDDRLSRAAGTRPAMQGGVGQPEIPRRLPQREHRPLDPWIAFANRRRAISPSARRHHRRSSWLPALILPTPPATIIQSWSLIVWHPLVIRSFWDGATDRRTADQSSRCRRYGRGAKALIALAKSFYTDQTASAASH